MSWTRFRDFVLLSPSSSLRHSERLTKMRPFAHLRCDCPSRVASRHFERERAANVSIPKNLVPVRVAAKEPCTTAPQEVSLRPPAPPVVSRDLLLPPVRNPPPPQVPPRQQRRRQARRLPLLPPSSTTLRRLPEVGLFRLCFVIGCGWGYWFVLFANVRRARQCGFICRRNQPVEPGMPRYRQKLMLRFPDDLN